MSSSKTETSSSFEGLRSCAFCLLPLTPAQVLKCSKCHRRTYCSRECQLADWKKGGKLVTTPTATGMGQGHKSWCGLPYGEEGIDWAVRDLPGGGKGLVALRDLPPLYRISVEGMQTLEQIDLLSHPGFRAIPDPPDNRRLGVTQEERKFNVNAAYSRTLGRVLGLRKALVTHSCDANAGSMDDDEFLVLVLYSRRAIAAGEAISLCQETFAFPMDPLPDPAERAKRLRMRGIQCTPSCLCKDAGLLAKLRQMRALIEENNRLENKGKRDGVLENWKRVAALGEEAGLGVDDMSSINFTVFAVASARSRTVGEGMPYLKKAAEYFLALFHPENKHGKKYILFQEEPSQYPEFGKWD